MPVTRLFESDHDVHRALEALDEAEVSRDIVTIINPADYNAADAVEAAIHGGAIREGHRDAVHGALARGRWVVAAASDWTFDGLVEETLDGAGAIEQGSIPEIEIHSPAPFSELLGIPVLVDWESQTELFDFDIDSSFGLPLVIDNPTPYSSLLRLPLLKSPEVSRLGMPQLKSSTVSRFGLPMLRRPRKSARGTAIERWANRPAPLSGLLGLPVLTRRR